MYEPSYILCFYPRPTNDSGEATMLFPFALKFTLKRDVLILWDLPETLPCDGQLPLIL